MSLASNVSSAFTRVGTEFKAIRTLIGGSGTANISALTTADKSSLVAAINEVKAGSSGAPPSASTSVQGVVELATDVEAVAGTDTVRAVTPSNVAAVFTDRIDTSTSLGTSSTKVPSQGAVKAYADALIAANDAMVFKGVIDASTNPNYPASNRGDTYRISVAGKIGGASGPDVEVGDLLIALTDGTASGTQAAVGAQWEIVQGNIDGAVTGPTSATSGDLATFNGTSGKVVQDSGISVDTDGTLAANSNTRLPTQQAAKTYTDTQVGDATTDFVATFVAALS